MKKITLLLSFIACVIFAQAQSTVYLETCGTSDVAAKPKVDLFTGWDNAAPITYTRTTTLDGVADVRITSTTTNNIWFPAGKGTDLIISNIPAAGYNNLKLSFDVATYTVGGTDVNKVNVYCNDVLITVPSGAIAVSNVFQSIGSIDLVSADVIKLRFEYTALNNPTGIGYRIDNIKIAGTPLISGVSTPKSENMKVIVAGNKLTIANASTSTVEIFNTVGAKVQSIELVDGSANLNLSKGLYIVRLGNQSSKIML